VEEVPQDDDAPGFQRIPASNRLGKLSKSDKIEAELAKGARPAREVFAAFGLDDSWTHVAVRLMERPGAGVFVTAKGKARPAGKKQGRPKESRIAVFKSTVLVEFLKSTAPPLEEPVEVEPPTVTAAPAKTTQRTPIPAEESSNLSSDLRGSTDTQPQTLESGTVLADAIDVADQTVTPAESEQPGLSERVDQTQTAQLPRDTPIEETTAGAISSTTATPARTADTPLSEDIKPTAPLSQPRVAFPKSRRSDKDGSVARLRRSIIMTLIEQAGGAFPSSSELWHAFASVWIRQHNHSETPDSRTVKGAVKYLVDAGKLRQLTFSGRTPKGEMVTRSIVMKPELDPSDPLVMSLQDAMLKANYYVPKNIDLDPNIAKIVRGGSSAAVSATYPKVTPVEPSITVQLKNKPAFVVALEKRREESLQKRLQQPVRLMGLQRKGKASNSKGITSFTRPKTKKRRRVDSISSQQGREEGTDYELPRTPMETTLLKHRLSQPLDRALAEVKRRRHESLGAESPYRRFVGEIDYVSQWERINQNANQSEIPPFSDPYQYTDSLSYVHHTIDEPFEQAPIDGIIQFDVDGVPRRRFRRTPAVKAKRQRRPAVAKTTPPQESQAQVFNEPEEYEMPLEYMVPQEYESFVGPPPEDVPTLLDPQLQEATSPQVVDATKPPMARRRRKGLRELGPRFIERLRYAIVVVRTVAGGPYGKMVDWEHVVRAFPLEDPGLVRQNGKLLLNRDRRQLAQMQEDIRDILLEEYRKPNCSLPSVDFNHLENYDWDALTTWAATQYYSPSAREVPNLPGSRAQFDRLHEYRVFQSNDQFESIYTQNPSITIAKREGMYSARPFVHTTSKRKRADGQRKRDEMDTAKSWILSNIIAKDQTYDSVEAKQKLSAFSSDVLDECVKEFVRDRVIMQENRGRIIPGRNYSLTENFYNTFGRRRAVDIEMLKQAAKTKQDLDADFKRDGFSQFKYTAVDGEALAILALAADGRVHIHPSNPPSDPTGLTEGNYETRALDKAKFKFEMVVAPDSQRYEYGNPVRDVISSHPIPIMEQDNADQSTLLKKPPLWVDINGNVNHDMWQSVVASVVGILAVRTNIPAQGIREQLQGYLAIWDVERTLAWLEGVGLAIKIDREEGDAVWKANGYWWLVLNS
jgi:transcription factor C subunit 3